MTSLLKFPARIRDFSGELTFCESSIRELEKASRGQSKSYVWKRQHKGRLSASHFHDVNAKVKKFMRKTGQSVKCKVPPLLAKLLLLDDIVELHLLDGNACTRKMLPWNTIVPTQ